MSPLPSTLAAFAVAALAAAPANAAVRWFHSPSGNIQCELRGTYAYCQTFEPARSVRLRADGRTKACSGLACLGNGPENAITLAYGRSLRLGPFRCDSRRTGVRCVAVRSGHGFELSRERLARF